MPPAPSRAPTCATTISAPSASAIRPLGGYAADCLEFAARCARPEGAYLHAMHSHMWGDMHYRITGLDAQGLPLLEGGWQNNRRMGMHNEYRYV